MSISWKKFTTAGAIASMVTGLILSVLLIILSKTVWVDILGNPKPIFPYKNPAIVSMTAAFIVGIIVSLLTKEPEAEEKYEEMKVRKYLGIGAE
jgi:cation/acetate symporter